MEREDMKENIGKENIGKEDTGIKFELGVFQDIGERERNEDRIFGNTINENPVFAVFDGAGGVSGGDIASERALEAFKDIFNGKSIYDILERYGKEQEKEKLKEEAYELSKLESELEKAVKTANKIIDFSGTTAAAIQFFLKENKAECINVGDSSIYVIDVLKKEIKKISKDHITRINGTKYLTSYLGIEENKLDFFKQEINELYGKVFLLCSDGLTDYVKDEEIKEIILSEKDPQNAVNKLYEKVLENKKIREKDVGKKLKLDNISILAIDFSSEARELAKYSKLFEVKKEELSFFKKRSEDDEVKEEEEGKEEFNDEEEGEEEEEIYKEKEDKEKWLFAYEKNDDKLDIEKIFIEKDEEKGEKEKKEKIEEIGKSETTEIGSETAYDSEIIIEGERKELEGEGEKKKNWKEKIYYSFNNFKRKFEKIKDYGLSFIFGVCIGAAIGLGIGLYKYKHSISQLSSQYQQAISKQETQKLERDKEKSEKSEKGESEIEEYKIEENEIELIKKANKRYWVSPSFNELELKIIQDEWNICGMKNVNFDNLYLRITTLDGKVNVYKFDGCKGIEDFIKEKKPSPEVKWAEVVELSKENGYPILIVHATYEKNENKNIQEQQEQQDYEQQEQNNENLQDHENHEDYEENDEDDVEDTEKAYNFKSNGKYILKAYNIKSRKTKYKGRASKFSLEELEIIKNIYFSYKNDEAIKILSYLFGSFTKYSLYASLDRLTYYTNEIYRKKKPK